MARRRETFPSLIPVTPEQGERRLFEEEQAIRNTIHNYNLDHSVNPANISTDQSQLNALDSQRRAAAFIFNESNSSSMTWQNNLNAYFPDKFPKYVFANPGADTFLCLYDDPIFTCRCAIDQEIGKRSAMIPGMNLTQEIIKQYRSDPLCLFKNISIWQGRRIWSSVQQLEAYANAVYNSTVKGTFAAIPDLIQGEEISLNTIKFINSVITKIPKDISAYALKLFNTVDLVYQGMGINSRKFRHCADPELRAMISVFAAHVRHYLANTPKVDRTLCMPTVQEKIAELINLHSRLTHAKDVNRRDIYKNLFRCVMQLDTSIDIWTSTTGLTLPNIEQNIGCRLALMRKTSVLKKMIGDMADKIEKEVARWSNISYKNKLDEINSRKVNPSSQTTPPQPSTIPQPTDKYQSLKVKTKIFVKPS